jgi:hypothetical protein
MAPKSTDYAADGGVLPGFKTGTFILQPSLPAISVVRQESRRGPAHPLKRGEQNPVFKRLIAS